MLVSAPQLHSKANINIVPEEAVARVAAVCRARNARAADHVSGRGCRGVGIDLSTVFGCALKRGGGP
jgi:hypothetical protein